jgi:hypothetical protein
MTTAHSADRLGFADRPDGLARIRNNSDPDASNRDRRFDSHSSTCFLEFPYSPQYASKPIRSIADPSFSLLCRQSLDRDWARRRDSPIISSSQLPGSLFFLVKARALFGNRNKI